MRLLFATALLTAALAPPQSEVGRSSERIAMAEFQALCLDWDGDLEATEAIVTERGYRPAQERLEAFTPRGSTAYRRYTFVWARQDDGVEIQVTARPRSYIGGGGQRVYQDICSVAVDPGNRTQLRNSVARHLGQDSFRQMGASVFVWTNGSQGRRAVRRAVFENRLFRLFTEEDWRMITVAQHGEQVILSYFTPSRESCRVRSEYSASEPNIVCGP